MKRFYTSLIILGTIAVTIWFDEIIVFLLSGFIPGINTVLAPSTMLAVMVASAIMVATLTQYRTIYQYCLAFYDEFLTTDNKTIKESSEKPNRPRRRYQEL